MPFKLKQGIKDQIIRGILDGSFRPGVPIPSTRALACTFKVSKATIQKIVNELKDENVLEAYMGKGVYVKAMPRPARKRKNRIGLLSPYDLEKTLRSGSYPFLALNALRAKLAAAGYRLSGIGFDGVDGKSLREAVAAEGHAGLVMLEINNSHLIAELQRSMLPIVSMDYDATHLGISSVVHDNLWGAYSAVKHLVHAGHREIIAFTRRQEFKAGANNFVDTVDRERLNGCRLALMGAGRDFCCVELPEEMEAMRATINEIFGRRQRPTAIFACHNFLTVKIIAELGRMGYVIPHDVEIVDFDGEGMELASGEKMTSVRVNHERLGEASADFMVSALNGTVRSPRYCMIETELSVNHSGRHNMRIAQ
jgi:LacI family transcriptional regulator